MKQTARIKIIKDFFILSSKKLVGDRITSLDRLGRLALSERNYGALATVAEELKDLSWISEDMGLYYQAISLNRKRNGNIVESEKLAIQLLDSQYPVLRMGAPLILAANCLNVGQLDEALRYVKECQRAMRDRGDLLYLANSQQQLSVIQSLNGDHQGSLESLLALNKLLPSLRFHFPATYFSHVNNVCVELCELGFLEAAAEYIKPAVNSPYSKAHLEWIDTASEIEEAKALRRIRRNFVCFPKPLPTNVIAIEQYARAQTKVEEDTAQPPPEDRSAGLVKFPLPKVPLYVYLHEGGRRYPMHELLLNGSQDSLNRQTDLINALRRDICTERETGNYISLSLVSEPGDPSEVLLNIEEWRYDDCLDLLDDFERDLKVNPLSEIETDDDLPPAALIRLFAKVWPMVEDGAR